jgi:hypothetical protein
MAASLSGDDYPLDVHQFAELVGKSADMVRHGVRHGRIQCHRHGRRGHLFFTREDVEAFFEASLVRRSA